MPQNLFAVEWSERRPPKARLRFYCWPGLDQCSLPSTRLGLSVQGRYQDEGTRGSMVHGRDFNAAMRTARQIFVVFFFFSWLKKQKSFCFLRI